MRNAFGKGLRTAKEVSAIDEIRSLTGRLNFDFKNDVVVDRTVLQKCYGFEMNRYLDVILTFSQSIAYGEKLVQSLNRFCRDGKDGKLTFHVILE